MTHLDAYKALLGKAHRAKLKATAKKADGDIDGHAAWLSVARTHKKNARKALASHKLAGKLSGLLGKAA